jgi:alanine racemase
MVSLYKTIKLGETRMNGRVAAYIHMDAVAHNMKNMKDNLREGVKMIAVVKTDAYGHGAVPIAQMVEPYEYLWGFAVAATEEAAQLRAAGIKKPILILGYTFAEDYAWMAANGVRPAVFTLEMAQQFSDAARQQGLCAPVHLAVDTGMSRIGVPDTDEGRQLAWEISQLPGIRMEGVFTHFAKADEVDDGPTRKQLQRFTQFCDGLKRQGVSDLLCHCSNSAGILAFPEANMDLVRAGISIYGIYPSEDVTRETVDLQPVMELKSRIVHLKTIEAGTPVSYGGTFVADHPMRIATIPVGYGDGYPRSLSNKGYVLIHGQKAPILGRVCMDQFMVDVTGQNAELLDEVTLLGKDGELEITLEELDALSGRFPYEFICDISKRVPRIYL